MRADPVIGGARYEVVSLGVVRFKAGHGVTTRTLRRLEKALEKGGIIFIRRDANCGTGVRLKR